MSELLNFIIDHEEAFKSRGRLASLYSDFSVQRTSNPDNYNANISAWRKALADAARQGLIPAASSSSSANDLLLVRTNEELSRRLQIQQFGRPLALGAVIADAVVKREWIPTVEFAQAKESIYRQGWSISPWKILSWGLRQLGIIGEDDAGNKVAMGEFVVISNVEEAANEILNGLSTTSTSGPSLIFSRATFTARFSHVLNSERPLSATDISLLITHLSRDRNALIYSPTSDIIKFRSPNANPNEPLTITAEDASIASLNTLIQNLQAQLPELTTKLEALDTDARTAVAKKQRTAALSALRSKKLVEKALEQRSATLMQLEDVYNKIDAASSQVEMVRVMQGSASVLRSLHQKVGGVEGVESVVEALNEEMGKVDEVSNIVNEVGNDQRVIAESEVDEEFEALEREEREQREAAEKEQEMKAEREREKEAEALRKRLLELESPQTELPGEQRSGEKTPEVEETRKDVEGLTI